MADTIGELTMITGMTRQAIILFCSNAGISYGTLKIWYMNNGRMPTMAECQQIKNS